jgi:NADH dehydrogenase
MVLGEDDYASRALARRARAKLAFTFRAGSLEQPIFAGDVIAAIVAGLDMALDGGLALDLGGPESLDRRALTQRAARVLGLPGPTLVSLPLGLGMAMAGAFETVSGNPPVTRAMLGVLDHDDAFDPASAAARLGITLTDLDTMLRRCVAAG